MNYFKELNKTLNLDLLEPIIQSGIRNDVEFNKLFALLASENPKVSWRAAWACEKISEINSTFFKQKHIQTLIEISISTKNEGLLRTCLVMLNNLSEPKTIDVKLLNACYAWLSSESSSIAVKAFSMKILYHFCLIEADLKTEFTAYLAEMDNSSLSAGVNSTKRNIIKLLNKK